MKLPLGAIAIVKPQTPVQLVNGSEREAIVLIVGAPATIDDAEYLPDASLA